MTAFTVVRFPEPASQLRCAAGRRSLTDDDIE
jgi:hypothetical protein